MRNDRVECLELESGGHALLHEATPVLRDLAAGIGGFVAAKHASFLEATLSGSEGGGRLR